MDKHQLGVRLTHQSYCMIQLFLRLLGWFTSCLPRDPCFEKTSSPTHLPNVSNCGDWQNDSPCPWGRAVFNVLSAYIIVLCIVQFCPGGELFDYIVAKERLKVWFSSRAYQVTYSEHAMCIKKGWSCNHIPIYLYRESRPSWWVFGVCTGIHYDVLLEGQALANPPCIHFCKTSIFHLVTRDK